MSIQSDAVKLWRKNVKIRAVEALGGECQICKYKKCMEALDFHHLDPSKKEFTFGSIIANPCNKIKIANELEKCILLCCICHREHHAGLTEIPLLYFNFDREIFLRETPSKVVMSGCLICGKLKPIQLITCSRSCASKRAFKIDWDLFDMYDLKINQKLPNTKIAEIVGVSDVAVKKRLKKLGIAQ